MCKVRRASSDSTHWGFALELSWHTLHSDAGPLLFGVWYRPPRRGETASIAAFDAELQNRDDFIGKIIVGDMNVHNAQAAV